MIGNLGLGLIEKALSLCEQRSGLLASNIANANTPHFKAKDINFQEALKQSQSFSHLNTTHKGHLTGGANADTGKTYYRIPMQTSNDGNTVDEEIERKNFMDNSIKYQASLAFAQSRSQSLLKAIRGD